MAGLNPTFNNLFTLIAALYPLFIVSFLFIASIFNSNIIKGLVYLGGIIVCIILSVLTGRFFDQVRPSSASLACNMLSIPDGLFLVPSLPIVIIAFTFTYLLIPMIESSQINAPMIIVQIILIGFNITYQSLNNCTNLIGIALSIVFGILIGAFWFTTFWISNQKELLFYNEILSNNVVCSRPQKQTFKCTVYKNGEIISKSVV